MNPHTLMKSPLLGVLMMTLMFLFLSVGEGWAAKPKPSDEKPRPGDTCPYAGCPEDETPKPGGLNLKPANPSRLGRTRGIVGRRLLPDLVFRSGVYMGGKFVPAGGTIVLSKKSAIKIKNGKCVFKTHYKIKNRGPVATPNKFRNRIRVDGVINSTVPDPRYSPGATLNAGVTMTMLHNTKLKPGMHRVVVSIDDDRNVLESRETNNRLSFRVRVKGSCKKGRGRQPDLVVRLTNPMAGRIVVKNIGNAPAGKTKLTLSCDKLPGNGRCPEPANPTPNYDDPAFPNHVVVKVPALAAGASYIHNLSFWSQLRPLWQPGRYKFVATADATDAVAERNETNNTATSFLRAN